MCIRDSHNTVSLRHHSMSTRDYVRFLQVSAVLQEDVNLSLIHIYTRYTVRIGFKQGIKGGDVNFEVTNFIVAPDKGLKYTISL